MPANALASVSADSEQVDLHSPARLIDVAVIIVTYKSAKLTVENLRSLAAERSTPGIHVRAVVVDNASGDLPEIAQAVESCDWSSWVTLVATPRNGGFAYGNNRGIEHAYASADPSYVHLLNPDARVRPGAISALVRFLEDHPEAGIAGSGFETGDGRDWPIAFRFPSLIGEIIQGLSVGIVTTWLKPWATVRQMTRSDEVVDWVSGASIMIRPAVFTAIGGMDENYFLFFEETDFCRRASCAGYSTWYVPESRVMHIGGQSTMLTPGTRLRLPAYWFESRRRYFAVTFGTAHAMAIDLIAVSAHSLAAVKRLILWRQHTAVPYFIRDLLRHSVLWRRNRNIPDARTTLRPATAEAGDGDAARSGEAVAAA
jgi:N-acetylglucosaminyl-diphospho-decaprenol L-rhamnosyltransferase